MMVAALATLLSVLAPGTQAAAEQPPFEHSWGPKSGRVSEIVRIGNVVYIAGTFTQITNGSSTKNRKRVAAFDAATLNPLSSWDPSFDNEVVALAASPDGSVLYVGG